MKCKGNMIALLICLHIAASGSCNDPVAYDSCNDLKMLGLAVQNYRSNFGSFPPASVSSRNGDRLHSWRVLILPFVEANGFKEQYDLESAWNSAANIDLANGERRVPGSKFPDPTMIRTVYTSPTNRSVAESFQTKFVILVDNEAPLIADYPHLRSDWLAKSPVVLGKITIVYLKQSGVHWMEPRDPDWMDIGNSSMTGDVLGAAVVDEEKVVCYDASEFKQLLASRKRELSRNKSNFD